MLSSPGEMRCKVITLAWRIMDLAPSDAPAACRFCNSLDWLNAFFFIRGVTAAICCWFACDVSVCVQTASQTHSQSADIPWFFGHGIIPWYSDHGIRWKYTNTVHQNTTVSPSDTFTVGWYFICPPRAAQVQGSICTWTLLPLGDSDQRTRLKTLGLRFTSEINRERLVTFAPLASLRGNIIRLEYHSASLHSILMRCCLMPNASVAAEVICKLFWKHIIMGLF